MRLEGKVAIVTGGATGIGKAIATRFAHEGAAVTIDYVGKADPAGEIVEAIEHAGGRALAINADISNEDDVRHLVEQTISKWGRLDILVNNAGVEEKHPFLDVPLALWNKTIAIDLTGPWLCTQAAARQMIQQGGAGRIINISSVHEDMPMPTNAPYCAAKGGLRMLMRTLAVELGPHQITVNNIGPGAIDTPMDAALKSQPELMKILLGEIPLGRMGKPEDVAGLAVYLASDEASYVTGSTYFIDGGMLRQAGSL
ncbi:MAG TPA: SDR family oxidoreductase [Chloroflexota bacterium]|jgi:glucose 1-dehydrogenase